MDPIDRQMAIDAFKKELTVGESKGNYVTLCSAVSYEGAKQILESLPSTQPEPQWIPCSECINYIDERCVVANHHVSEKENCMEVFGAKRRTVERRRGWLI